MSSASLHTLRPAEPAGVLHRLAAGTAGLVETMRQRLSRTRTRRIVSGLTDEQLADIGVDRSAVVAPAPIFTVEAGLIANLTAMR